MSDNGPADVTEQKAITEQPTPETAAEREQSRTAADFGRRAAKSGQEQMLVKVHSPFREYYNGQALSVSAVNATGPFDILPRHHNFISLLSPCELVIRSPGGDQKIRISGGVMHVKADRIIVFLDI